MREITVFDLSRAIARRRWFVAVAAGITTAIAILVALLMTPIYRAEVLVAPVERENPKSAGLATLTEGLGGIAELAGVAAPGGNDIETTLAVLTSRAFINNFVNNENLKSTLFAKRWNAGSGTWYETNGWSVRRLFGRTSSTRVRETESLVPGEPSAWDVYRIFHEDVLKVSRDRLTGHVIIGVEWTDPIDAAAWANTLIETLNNELRQEAIDEAEKLKAALLVEVEKTSNTNIHAVLYGLIEKHIQASTLAQAKKDYALKVLDPAMAPDKPARPKVAQTALLGLLLGLLGGIFVVLVHYLAVLYKEPDNAKQGG